MKKFHVRLPNNVFKSYECDPLSIKKKISQNVSIQFDRIILIDLHQDLNQIYSALKYQKNTEYEEIQLQVVDLAILIRENVMLKKALNDNKKKIKNMDEQIREAKKESENAIFLQRDQQIQELQFKIFNLQKSNEDFEDQQVRQQELITDFQNQIFQMQKQIEDQNKNLEQYDQNYKQLQMDMYYCNQALQQYSQSYMLLLQQYQELEQSSDENLKKQKKKFKEEIEELEDKLSRQENEKNTEIENLKSELQMIKIENQDGKQQILTMKQQFEASAKLRSSSFQEDCQMKLYVQGNQFQDQINALKLEHQLKISNLQEHINKQKLDIDQLQGKLNNMKKKQENDKQEFEAEWENVNKKQKMDQKKFESIKKQLEEDLNKKQQECNRKDREKKEVEDQNQTLSSKIYQLQSELKLSKQQLQQSQMDNEGLEKKLIEYSKLIIEKEKFIKSRVSIIKKISSEKKKKPLEDIVNAYERLYKLNFANQIIQGSNSQWDDQNYQVFEIIPTTKIIKKIQQQEIYDIGFDDLKIEDFGQMEISRSLQPNAEGEYYNIYFLIVEEQTKSKLAKQYLARKHFKSSQSRSYPSLQQAALASLNQIITDAFIQIFNQILTKSNVKFNKIQVPPQIVLQNGEEFYNCELIMNQQIKKINGGEYNIGLDETSQYLNSFSQFTHTFSKKQCIVSNIFANNNFMYEMIVSTNEGFLSELDAGRREIEKTLGNMRNKSPQCYGRFYNDQIDKMAQSE